MSMSSRTELIDCILTRLIHRLLCFRSSPYEDRMRCVLAELDFTRFLGGFGIDVRHERLESWRRMIDLLQHGTIVTWVIDYGCGIPLA